MLKQLPQEDGDFKRVNYIEGSGEECLEVGISKELFNGFEHGGLDAWIGAFHEHFRQAYGEESIKEISRMQGRKELFLIPKIQYYGIKFQADSGHLCLRFWFKEADKEISNLAYSFIEKIMILKIFDYGEISIKD